MVETATVSVLARTSVAEGIAGIIARSYRNKAGKEHDTGMDISAVAIIILRETCDNDYHRHHHLLLHHRHHVDQLL